MFRCAPLLRIYPRSSPRAEQAARRFFDFFTSNIRNRHPREAYGRAVNGFLLWCEVHGVRSLADVQPLHVAAWIEAQTLQASVPTVKQRLAAIRHFFDWLVVGQIVPVNPAASVRGPKHIVRKGKTPVLEPIEARALLDSIDTATPVGLRDRALIGLMVYSFARIGAALGMKIEDVYSERRRLWVRLHEKGGKRHEMPCHHNLETYLTAYIEKTGITDGGTLEKAASMANNTITCTLSCSNQVGARRALALRSAQFGVSPIQSSCNALNGAGLVAISVAVDPRFDRCARSRSGGDCD